MKPSIFIDGCQIPESTLARNLGLLLDNGLKFEEHIKSKIGKCYGALKQLYKIREFLSVPIRHRLTDALVLSHLDYCDIVYGPCLYKKTENKIQRVQNSCIRFCHTVPPRSHITPYLNSFNILKMSNRRKLKLNTLVFKLRQTSNPSYLSDKLNWNDRKENTARSIRYPLLQLSMRCRLTLFAGSFRFAATKCWNDLPPPLRKLKSLPAFKRKCRQWLLDTQKSECIWSAVDLGKSVARSNRSIATSSANLSGSAVTVTTARGRVRKRKKCAKIS